VDYTEIMCKIGENKKIPKTWVLLDNQSTVDVFFNPELLVNIRRSRAALDIYCNAGKASTDLIGDLPGYGWVWYHPNGIANILSLSRVKKKSRVTYDSEAGNSFVVHKSDGTTRSFVESKKGLYYVDTINEQHNDNKKAHGNVLINTVDDNKSRYTDQAYSRALVARSLQIKIGRPSTR
jgi:hypothetical protein